MENFDTRQKQRVTRKQKNAAGKKWYKDWADTLDTNHHSSMSTKIDGSDLTERRRMQVNYNLFNNILDEKDFMHVCKPFGKKLGKMPAKMTNKDISSGKIKSILGMEMSRPNSWEVVATNPEATSKREQEEFSLMKQYVIDSIMKPIREQEELAFQKEIQGQDLTPEQEQEALQQLQQRIQTKSPPEVKKYMSRTYQDPAEIMSKQLINYLIQKTDLTQKFNTAFKHLTLSAKEVMYVGTFNGEPDVWNVNSLNFQHDSSPDQVSIESGQWATCEYRMTPSEVIGYFGDDLTPKEMDRVFEQYSLNLNKFEFERLFSYQEDRMDLNQGYVRVLHTTWKSLRPIKFLTYMDLQTGLEHTKMVDESYRLNPANGDIALETEWINEAYETWKIGSDIYVKMQPIPGQHKDLDNLDKCNLPYYGMVCDAMNSVPTAPMDRLKIYQYFYNIINYRLETLIASDKGKKVLMDIAAIPDSESWGMDKWLSYFETSPFLFFNSAGEGYRDASTLAKSLDFSLISDIGKYIELLKFIDQQAGDSTGITKHVEGQTGPREAVTNAQQSLQQSSHILQPYFDLHNLTKRNVLTALFETAKIAYRNSNKKKLVYVLDDMSREMINLDLGLLEASTIGLFFSNSAKAHEAAELIKQLSHAAMQNQSIEMSDVMTIMRLEGAAEVEEALRVAEDNRQKRNMELKQMEIDSNKEAAKAAEAAKVAEHEREKELVVLKASEERKTKLEVAKVTAASFNPDQDANNDGINDFLQIDKHVLDAETKRAKIRLDEKKLNHTKRMDKEKLKTERQKLKIAEKKQNKPTNNQ